jgi:hypothetical protein
MTSENMIERVARALHTLPSERWSEVPWDELQTQERDRIRHEARTAIKVVADELNEYGGEPALQILKNALRV